MLHRNLFIALPALALFGCPTPTTEDPGGVPDDLDAIVFEERPSKRSEAIAVPNEALNEILMFGGNEAPIVNQIPRAEYSYDTWIFQPGWGWRQMDVDGPSARGRYGAAFDSSSGRALLFGGRWREPDTSGDYTLYGDLWALRLRDGDLGGAR